MGSENLHERDDVLSEDTKNLHRAIVSLMEELEAVDWYTQRSEGCTNDELREILVHNRDEEIEHAMMTLEWIRRKHPGFAENIEEYIGATGRIVGLEAASEGRAESENDAKAAGGKPAVPGKAAGGHGDQGGSLGIGSLKEGA